LTLLLAQSSSARAKIEVGDLVCVCVCVCVCGGGIRVQQLDDPTYGTSNNILGSFVSDLYSPNPSCKIVTLGPEFPVRGWLLRWCGCRGYGLVRLWVGKFLGDCMWLLLSFRIIF